MTDQHEPPDQKPPLSPQRQEILKRFRENRAPKRRKLSVQAKTSTDSSSTRGTILAFKRRSPPFDKRLERLRSRPSTITRSPKAIDQEILTLGAELAVFHIEAGTRKFVDFKKVMVEDLGEKIRPYLKTIYLGVRHWPGMEQVRGDMDSEADIERIEELG